MVLPRASVALISWLVSLYANVVSFDRPSFMAMLRFLESYTYSVLAPVTDMAAVTFPTASYS